MRTVLFVALLGLAGCQSYFDDQQRQVDEANATRDHRWCEDLGIPRTDARYPDCRIVAADLRQRGQAQADSRALGLLGLGVTATRDSSTTTHCQTFGGQTTCTSD